MMDKQWVWGNCDSQGKFAVFENLEVDGGYKCHFCEGLLTKRWDGLKVHLTKCKKKPKDIDIKTLLENIQKIKVKCAFCDHPLDMTGCKEARHLAICKGFKAVVAGREVNVEGRGKNTHRVQVAVRENTGQLKWRGKKNTQRVKQQGEE